MEKGHKTHLIRTLQSMVATLIGYARCSTDRQDLTAIRSIALRARRLAASSGASCLPLRWRFDSCGAAPQEPRAAAGSTGAAAARRGEQAYGGRIARQWEAVNSPKQGIKGTITAWIGAFGGSELDAFFPLFSAFSRPCLGHSPQGERELGAVPAATPDILAPTTALAYPVADLQTEIRTAWQPSSTPATTS